MFRMVNHVSASSRFPEMVAKSFLLLPRLRHLLYNLTSQLDIEPVYWLEIAKPRLEGTTTDDRCVLQPVPSFETQATDRVAGVLLVPVHYLKCTTRCE
jgi:hypothetical protein